MTFNAYIIAYIRS